MTGDSGPGDLRAATRAAYDAAVVALVPQVSQAELSQQQEIAREAAVKEGVHSLQIGVQSYAVDHNDVYPPDATQAYLKQYIDT